MPDSAASPFGLGAALRHARRQRGWSQRELAVRAGVHQPQVARVERGEDCQLSLIARLSAPLGLLPVLAKAGAEVASQAGVVAARGEPGSGAAPDLRSMLGDGAQPVAHLQADEHALVPELDRWARAWPDVDPRVFALISLLTRLGRHASDGLEQAAKRHGLSGGDVMLMGALRRKGPPYQDTPTGLKPLLWISLPGLKKRVDRLLEAGMISRVGNPVDRRGVLVGLTPHGHALLSDLVAHPQSGIYRALLEVSALDRALLAPLLHGLLMRIENPPAGSA